MKLFKCTCGSRLYFENTKCLNCDSHTGFVWQAPYEMLASKGEQFVQPITSAVYLRCKNAQYGICNWLTAKADTYCESCALSRTIPDLSSPHNVERLGEVERAKRRVLYALGRLRLPVASKQTTASGLCFDVLATLPGEKVVIGHADGVITIALDEADPVHRERQRCTLGEAYRTVLGHLRHEIGHYYFTRLVEGTPQQGPFRELFGDERCDYQAALERHYKGDSEAGWEQDFVTPYAAAHPWEDWAESWAHYMHTTSASETALCHGLQSDTEEVNEATREVIDGNPVSRASFDKFMQFWAETSVVLNELNRSMGVAEAYPFIVREKVTDKLYFVHRTIVERKDLSSAGITSAA